MAKHQQCLQDSAQRLYEAAHSHVLLGTLLAVRLQRVCYFGAAVTLSLSPWREGLLSRLSSPAAIFFLKNHKSLSWRTAEGPGPP